MSLTGTDHLDATALAELVRKKEVTPSELLERAIERVEALNPKLNAVIRTMYDEGRKTAAGALPDGPFRGVPFLIKDLMAGYAGVPLASSSRFTKDFVPRYDNEIVIRQKKAGLVIFGKTNTPEFGLPPTTEPELWGKTRNPWDLSRSTGGSSGGSAAAVASGMVPMAHGGDGGGSIRIPASCCGLFGMKPTRGRNPLGPDAGDIMHGLVVEHAITRTVRDSAALLDATRGMDVGAPYDAPAPVRPYADEVKRRPGKLKIAYTTKTLTGTKVNPDCIAAVDDAAALCRSLGHEVTEQSLDVPGSGMLVQSFMALWGGGLVQLIDIWSLFLKKQPTEADFEPMTWALYQMAKSTPLSMYLLAHAQLQKLARDLQKKWIDHDVWLTPTLAEPPLPLGALDAQEGNPLAGLFRAGEYVPFTPIFNVTGQPAMSVPLYWNASDLPIGTHFVGRFGDEGTLYQLAAQLEEARPWAARRPQITI